MLRTRLITAFVLLAVLLPLLGFASARGFGLAMGVFAAAGMWEWARLAGFRGARAVAWACVWLLAVLGMLLSPLAGLDPDASFALAALAWAALLLGSLPRASLPRALGAPLVLGLLGFVILFAAWMALWHARQIGVSFLVSVLMLAWVADVAAYFGGRAIGGARLAPRISPGKTVSGALCGVAGVLAYTWVCARMPQLHDTLGARLAARWGLPGALLVCALLTGLSVAGDLFESLLKRRAGVKDSSALLPGHGGVLDRVDALLPLLPVVMLLVP
ncbi:MAG: phosphatidate cytidylyltransferase [Betaproteobacteria bacterium]|nr:phosphatidate cytidylyltransferase [Betaproteobacteria bacterium]